MDKPELQLLDQLHQPALVLSPTGEPVYLTPAGAEILQIRTRDRLDECRRLLDPLIKMKNPTMAPIVLSEEKRAQELMLNTVEGVPVPVLAIEMERAEEQGRVILFWDLRPFQGWFLVMQQAQRTRPSIVYASAIIGQTFNEHAVEALLMHQAIDLSSRFKSEPGIDLLHALTRAVEIVDSLVAPSFRIHLHLPTSALVAISQVALLRMFSHALLEAFDYSGALGRARVGAFFTDNSVRVLVLGSRQEKSGLEVNVLEQYLSRRAFSIDYRVRHGGENEMDIPPEERAFLEKHLDGKDNISFDLIRSLPEGSYSENLRIAKNVADSSKTKLSVRLNPPRHILVSLELPIVGANALSGKRPAFRPA